MPTTGAGLAPAGTSYAGFGTPESVPATARSIYRSATRETLSGRQIDPVTRDYVLDDRGRAKGMTEAQQFVFLALRTDIGSSAVASMGNRLKTIQVITDSFQREVTEVITSALSPGVQRSLIAINSITVERRASSQLFALVRWTDLSTGREETSTVNG